MWEEKIWSFCQMEQPIVRSFLVHEKRVNIHEYMTNARKDYWDKVSTEIIKRHDVIGIEDL